MQQRECLLVGKVASQALTAWSESKCLIFLETHVNIIKFGQYDLKRDEINNKCIKISFIL